MLIDCFTDTNSNTMLDTEVVDKKFSFKMLWIYREYRN